MTFEHFALNVPDARATAAWYVKHLGFKILMAKLEGSFAHFLADATGRCVLELYTNPKASIPDYFAQSHLVVHFALAVPDADAAAAKLLADGATPCAEDRSADGRTVIITLRDPWGIPVQFCQRAQPW